MVLGSDADFWEQVGIDPVRVMTGGGTFYTLRCYFDERPIFLGRNGQIQRVPLRAGDGPVPGRRTRP